MIACFFLIVGALIGYGIAMRNIRCLIRDRVAHLRRRGDKEGADYLLRVLLKIGGRE